MATNVAPLRAGFNAFAGDGVLMSLAAGFDAPLRSALSDHGAWTGSAEALDLARMANEHPPVLRGRDARGDRIDRVEFHPAYHALMRRAVSLGLQGSVWDDDPKEKGHRHELRALRFMMQCELEAGHTCPITMTNAAGAVFLNAPDLAADWMSRIRSRSYDSRHRPALAKSAVTIGMGMTERQGGTDLRQITTNAQRGSDGEWVLNGEKWFFSAPMCDAFFILARTQVGVSCFLVPRIREDGVNNGLKLERLKEKVGNRSNASGEVTIENAVGTLVGEEGKGIATIIDMVTMTRLDCAISSAGHMRAALDLAVHNARHRVAFGKKLIDQPLMARVLADMALDVAAAQALSVRLARAYDASARDDAEGAWARLMTPVTKYWVCKAATPLIAEAMECLGGNGYVEDGPMARLYREAPLNAIWEGSGNVMCLDVMRVMGTQPKLFGVVLERIAQDMGQGAEQGVDVLRVTADMAATDPGSARLFTEQLALTAAAAEMRRLLPRQIADAFIESRLGRPWRHTYGMIDARYDARAIVDFLFPQP